MMSRRSIALIAGASLFATLIAPIAGRSAATGADIPHPSALCLSAIESAQNRYETPPGLLAVMSKVESGRPAPPSGALQPWPWTVDADGEGIFFATKQQAVDWARAALASGAVTYLDVGCMQVDLRMHPAAFRNLDEAFDPKVNARFGARFLRELHDGAAGGNWFTAVGLYHSQTPALAALYREQVAAVGAGLPPPGMSTSHFTTLRLNLAGGGVLRINVNRQPARIHRHLSPCQVAAILGSYLPRRVRGCSASR